MSQVLTIRVRPEPQYAILTAVAEIDIATVSQPREQLFALAGDGRPLVADLDQVVSSTLPGSGSWPARQAGRRARQQPACGLRPAPDPAAVRPDRAGQPDTPGPHAHRGAAGPWQHWTRPPPAPPASPARETLGLILAAPGLGRTLPAASDQENHPHESGRSHPRRERNPAPRASLTPTAVPVFSAPNQPAKDMRRPCQQRWAGL